MAEQRKEEEVKRKAEEVSMVDLNQSSFSLKTNQSSFSLKTYEP